MNLLTLTLSLFAISYSTHAKQLQPVEKQHRKRGIFSSEQHRGYLPPSLDHLAFEDSYFDLDEFDGHSLNLPSYHNVFVNDHFEIHPFLFHSNSLEQGIPKYGVNFQPVSKTQTSIQAKPLTDQTVFRPSIVTSSLNRLAEPIVKPYRAEQIPNSPQSFQLLQQQLQLPGPADFQLNQVEGATRPRPVFVRNFGAPLALGSGSLGFARLPNGAITIGSGSLGYTALYGSGLRFRGSIPGAGQNDNVILQPRPIRHYGFTLP